VIRGGAHPTPRLGHVVAAQIRVVGAALRGPGRVACALVALATVLLIVERAGTGEAMAFHPEYHALPGLLGLLLPFSVWRGEERFGAGLLWTLPVDRRGHALARIFAGWVWLMALMTLFVLWLLALVVVSGGNVLSEETRRVVPSFSTGGTGPFDSSAVELVRQSAQPLLWLVPFTAATGTYLFANALALGTRKPLSWISALVAGGLLFVSLAEAANADWLIRGGNRLLEWLVYGPYGVDALLTARTESLQVAATLSSGETSVVWSGLPDIGQWAVATMLWTVAGLVTVWAAASRHQEARRA
jgi:hypothetical protein